MGKQSGQQADRQDSVKLDLQELHSWQIKLKQTVQENIDAVLALLALVDIEPVTWTRTLRYNQIIKSALALNGIDLSVTDDEEAEAGAESDKNKGESQTAADKPEKVLFKFGRKFLGGLIRKDFKESLAAARNLDLERRLHWAACSGAILVYGRNDTAKQKLTPSELSLHDMIKKEWLYDER
ncbi:hypothetical protein HMPREF2865_10260 [Neisseria sp. HMSC073G10]|jgi:hypothetical protein|uniref:hypothetical protein n=1 Tax=Neisseria sp. HMSC073G10 TaxID=1739369 RepID=UPI0008A65415|nr:hypothetical protein [Neisseria sp. HMSC073G10]OFR82879.1 hypothetical protein HMPREF2865_10260 [Neisseria sp. HMSC073G10]DAT70367.1 MAG TPA: hypothetical protein [Bacteriophage sp.]